MEKGIFDWFGYLIPMEERFAMIRAAGFDTVMLWWGSDFDTRPGEYLGNPSLAERYGLRVENAHLPYFNSNELWTGGGYEKLLLDGIRNAADYGIPVLVAHVADGETPPPPCAKGFDSLLRVAELCERLNVRLALENTKCTEHLTRALSDIRSDFVGFCYDIGHSRAVSGRDHTLLRQYASRLTALHLHDNDGSDDQHLLPFDGDVDWNTFAEILPRTAYRGSLTLEAIEPNWQDPDRISPEGYLAEAFRRICRLEALIRGNCMQV